MATLLQHDDWNTDNNNERKSEQNANEKPICRYYLKGECKFIDCMYSHEIATRAVCKYWLWGYCSRKSQCIYKHALPSVDIQKLQQQQAAQKKQSAPMAMPKKPNKQKKASKIVKKKPPSDLVAKLRLNLLKESFPRIHADKIKKIFVSNEYNLEATRECLMRKFKVKPIDVINDGIRKQSVNVAKEKRKGGGKDINYGLMHEIGWVETGDSLNNLYKNKRCNAEEHARRRNDCFMRAVDAYLSGNRKLAKDLSVRGRGHQREMQRLHREAGNQIYEARNRRLKLNVIDLHGLHVEEGVDKIRERIMRIKRNAKNMKQNNKKKNEFVLDILTGTGHHSFGGHAKIGPAIVNFARKNKIKFKKMNFVDGRGGNVQLFIQL